MFYIHQNSCISHQPTFDEVDLENLKPSENNFIYAIEPKYAGVPPGQLRRMGRALRMGVGAGMKLLLRTTVDGILVATANGGIEDSIIFLNQIREYEEGRLTPTNFVQSTYNAIAGMMSMITANKGYNTTHVHRGHAFENVVLDAAMLLLENPESTYIIGGVDEISEHNHQIVSLGGWYKKEPLLNSELYNSKTDGTLPGEGAAMFIVNNSSESAVAKLSAVKMVSSADEQYVQEQLKTFLKSNLKEGEEIDLLLLGENGDQRLKKYYDACASVVGEQTTVAGYKHAFGEFQTVSALALWLACHVLQTQKLPVHFIRKIGTSSFERILICNNYQGLQHGFLLVEAVS